MAQPRALISVWHKEGVEELSKALSDMNWQILSTGGTARKLRAAGISVIDVSEATGHPEVFDGRVKTLHPAVHGGILARRDREDDMETLQELGYGPIDLVCVNLYPFAETAARVPPATDSELIEMIDIGGPTMVRSAAKNHKDVIVLTSPPQYEGIIEQLRSADGDPSAIDLETRAKLALESFQGTAAYDSAVSNELERRLSDAQTPREYTSPQREARISDMVRILISQHHSTRQRENQRDWPRPSNMEASHFPTTTTSIWMGH